MNTGGSMTTSNARLRKVALRRIGEGETLQLMAARAGRPGQSSALGVALGLIDRKERAGARQRCIKWDSAAWLCRAVDVAPVEVGL